MNARSIDVAALTWLKKCIGIALQHYSKCHPVRSFFGTSQKTQLEALLEIKFAKNESVVGYVKKEFLAIVEKLEANVMEMINKKIVVKENEEKEIAEILRGLASDLTKHIAFQLQANLLRKIYATFLPVIDSENVSRQRLQQELKCLNIALNNVYFPPIPSVGRRSTEAGMGSVVSQDTLFKIIVSPPPGVEEQKGEQVTQPRQFRSHGFVPVG